MHPNDIANYGFGIFGVAGIAMIALRWAIKAFHVDTLAIKSQHAEVNVIDRLESEIVRLEEIIGKQQIQISRMTVVQNNLQRLLNNQRAILMTIEMVLENMCTCDTEAKRKISKLIAELISVEEES